MASETPTGPGRPRALPEDPLTVAIESVGNDSLSLVVPNKLLFKWYQENTGQTSEYLSLLNDAVPNHVIQLKSSDDLAHKLCQRAGSVYRYVRHKKSGRARMEYLKLTSSISVSHDDVIKTATLQADIIDLEEEVAELQSDLTNAMEELVLCQDAVQHMTSQLNQVFTERDELVNKGSPYEDVGAKQKKRKLAQFKKAVDAALWFSESFGLVPTHLTACVSTSDEAISIPLGDSPTTPPDTQPTRRVDEFAAMQTLYLLDRFGVSDEFYHELTQVHEFVPSNNS